MRITVTDSSPVFRDHLLTLESDASLRQSCSNPWKWFRTFKTYWLSRFTRFPWPTNHWMNYQPVSIKNRQLLIMGNHKCWVEYVDKIHRGIQVDWYLQVILTGNYNGILTGSVKLSSYFSPLIITKYVFVLKLAWLYLISMRSVIRTRSVLFGHW